MMSVNKKSFLTPEKQALKAITQLTKRDKTDKLKVHLGTARDYKNSFIQAAKFLEENFKNRSLQTINPDLARRFLDYRSETVKQSQLNQDRQALEVFMKNTKALDLDKKLTFVKSELKDIVNARAYRADYVDIIKSHQTEPYSLATSIAFDAGLRASELLSINYSSEQPPTNRDNDKGLPIESKFLGHEGVKYTVNGKGGLIREVIISKELSQLLEERRLTTPRKVVDREIYYKQHYDIGGGKKWSDSFNKASNRHLGYSTGAHGLRHSYAQNRMAHLMKYELLDRNDALRTVSQELGHFRPDITECYLR